MSASIRQLAPRGDPTRTSPISTKYAQRLRGQLGHLNAAIRRGVDRDDSLGLRVLDTLQPVDDPPVFRFQTNDKKREAFMRWLRRQLDRSILEVVGEDDNVFIRQAYSRAVQDADVILNAEGVTVSDEDLQAIFNTPVHRDALANLFTRNFENLENITDDMARAISEELTDGFSRGIGPREMARNLTGRVDAIGKHRATVLARTEVINAHSTATLNRYEQMGVRNVTIRGEILTAGDERVCPLCASIAGEVMTITEVRDGTFAYQAGEAEPASLTGDWPIQPPIHAMCRCRVLPVVS